MSPAQTQPRHTVEEYLALERESEGRHEYLDGQIYEMAGESRQHGDICVNLVRELSSQLRGTPCRVWTKDAKVLSGPTIKTYKTTKGLFSYPDLVVVCGEPRFLDDRRDVLINPNVIIEVLSPVTERHDRGEKFWRYRMRLSTLTDYVLVSQTMRLVERFRRQSDDQWIMSTASELDAALRLSSIDCALRLSEVYDRVAFSEETLEQHEQDELL